MSVILCISLSIFSNFGVNKCLKRPCTSKYSLTGFFFCGLKAKLCLVLKAGIRRLWLPIMGICMFPLLSGKVLWFWLGRFANRVGMAQKHAEMLVRLLLSLSSLLLLGLASNKAMLLPRRAFHEPP
jgi:hypothetical protein